MELKPKIVLKQKGQEAYVSINQLKVTLKWSANVDLDLMAFYKTKKGEVGGVFSEHYSGGNRGSLNSFPFIELSTDMGIEHTYGKKEEILRISNFEHFEEVYICTINFTDASKGNEVQFNNYDASIELIDNNGENITIPLDSSERGTVAVIAKIQNSFMGPKLINENRVIDFNTFQNTIPGANLLNLASKIVLKKKGDTYQLKQKDNKLGEILVNLNWSRPQNKGFLSSIFNKGIDLDLGVLYELYSGSKGAIQALGNAYGAYNKAPYILHCGDDRTGDWAEGENIRINGDMIDKIKRILVYAYIYEGTPNWASADGVVTIKAKNQPEIIVHLDEHRNNLIMCAIALLENINNNLQIKKIVQYFDGHESMDRAFNWGLRWVAGSKD